MIGPVSPSRPVDVLRQSSDQIRRAAALLAEITEETTDHRLERRGGAPSVPAPGVEDQAAREATIQQAQRSFVAGLRLGRSGRHHRDPSAEAEA